VNPAYLCGLALSANAGNDEWIFGSVTVVSYSRGGRARRYPNRDDDSDADDPQADDDDPGSISSPADDDDTANDGSMGTPVNSDGEAGASPTSTTQPTLAPTSPPATTPLPTTPPPTTQPPTASPTVTPVLANITGSAMFDTMDMAALVNETYKETFETDLKETMAANLPGVKAKDIDIIDIREGSVVVRVCLSPLLASVSMGSVVCSHCPYHPILLLTTPCCTLPSAPLKAGLEAHASHSFLHTYVRTGSSGAAPARAGGE
jgi:hypothetical protein